MQQDSSSAQDEPQRINGPDGKPLFVIVPAEDYDALKEALDALKGLRSTRAALARGIGCFEATPAPVAHRIADGENPVRVWREWRGLKGVALARAAGISPAYLSEIETGKKDGTFRTMAGIARVLKVSLDDLAPPADEGERRVRERNALMDGMRAQVRRLTELVTGPVDFNTAAVRRTVTTLAADAVALKAQGCNPEGLFDELLAGVRAVLDLVDHAENDIIETAHRARQALEAIVSGPAFAAQAGTAAQFSPDGNDAPEPPPAIGEASLPATAAE